MKKNLNVMCFRRAVVVSEHLDITLTRFPSHQKYTLRKYIEESMYACIHHLADLINIKKPEYREKLADKAITELDHIKNYLFLAYYKGYLGKHQMTSSEKKYIEHMRKESLSRREMTDREIMKEISFRRKKSTDEYMKRTKEIDNLINSIKEYIKKHK